MAAGGRGQVMALRVTGRLCPGRPVSWAVLPGRWSRLSRQRRSSAQPDRRHVVGCGMERLTMIANRLMRDGAVDNVPDAYLAAIRIVAAAELLDGADRLPVEPVTAV